MTRSNPRQIDIRLVFLFSCLQNPSINHFNFYCIKHNIYIYIYNMIDFMIDCMITTTYICNIELIRIDAGGGRLGPGTWWIDFLEYVYGKYVDASTRVDEQRGWHTVEEDRHSCFVGFALRGMECVNLPVTVWTVIVLHGSTSCGLPPGAIRWVR